MDEELARQISDQMGKGPASKGPMYFNGKKYEAGEYPNLQQPCYDAAHHFAKEFDRRIQQAIIKTDGSLPTDLSIVAQHGRIDVDPDGTRRFFWRGEEKFHMRIDVNWREDGQ